MLSLHVVPIIYPPAASLLVVHISCVGLLQCKLNFINTINPELWRQIILNSPGLSSSKSDSILQAVQGFTPSVAAHNKGMSLAKEITASSATTASVLHVPVYVK